MLRSHRHGCLFVCLCVCPLVVFYLFTRTQDKEQEYWTKVKQWTDRVVQENFTIPCLGQPPGSRSLEDVFCMKKPDFLPNYRNPCWKVTPAGAQTLRINCLPYFHVLGVDKAGTTDLYHRIMQHRHASTCACSREKESFYWANARYGMFLSNNYTDVCSFKCFQFKYFDSINRIEQEEENGFHPRIIGDGSPADFWDFRAWRRIPQNIGLQEPLLVTPHIMRHMYKDPKFIISLRNPTDRLYSDFIFLGGHSSEEFHRAVVEAIHKIEECFRKHTERYCFFDFNVSITLPTRITIGAYSVFMREWLKVFPRNQFLILRYEDYSRDIEEQLPKVFDFLKLDYNSTFISEVAKRKKKNVTQRNEIGPMMNQTRTLLVNFYRKYTQDLAEMLDDDRFLWPD